MEQQHADRQAKDWADTVAEWNSQPCPQCDSPTRHARKDCPGGDPYALGPSVPMKKCPCRECRCPWWILIDATICPMCHVGRHADPDGSPSDGQIDATGWFE